MKIMQRNTEIKNHENLSENEIFEKVKEEITPIQENLSEKRITVEKARDDLQKINERIQSSKLEKKDKKEFWKAFEKLTKLEKNVDEKHLKVEVDKIINLLEIHTKSDLANLEHDVQKIKNQSPERSAEAKEWLKKASQNLEETISSAENDDNLVASFAGKLMKKLMS